MKFKRIQLGINDFLLIAINGQIYHVKDGVNKKVEFTLDVRKRGDKKFYYYRFSANNKLFYAHKIIATAWIENPNDFKFTRHIDGNTLNNSISNLEWVYNSQDVKNHYRELDCEVYYCSLNRNQLSGQNIWIYDYYMDNNEIPIREMFQGSKLRAICRWKTWQQEGDKFETLYDDLYENLLSKIKRGVIMPRVGEKHNNSLFNYAVRLFDWLTFHRKKQYQEILNLNKNYIDL